MKRSILLFATVSALSLSAHAADSQLTPAQTSKPADASATDPANNPAPVSAGQASSGNIPDADNTKRNERDKSGQTRTPGDQSNSPQDLEITRNIRQSLVKDDALSQNAKNVKVITINGTVTLRGVVNSPAEKAAIEKAAQQAAGGGKVESQLEVKQEQ